MLSLLQSFGLFMLISMGTNIYFASIGNKELVLNLMFLEMPLFTYFMLVGYNKLIEYEEKIIRNHGLHSRWDLSGDPSLGEAKVASRSIITDS